MKRLNHDLCFFPAEFIFLIALMYLVGCGNSTASQKPTERLTARMLVAPNALMGPGPSGFCWSPRGAVLAYVEPTEGRDVLWAYDATTGVRRVLLDPGDNPDQISLLSAQWSPQGDFILLSGANALWLLDVNAGGIKSLAAGSSAKTGLMFSPDGSRISFVQNNDLYTVRISDGQLVRLTADGSETVFNGTLDWVYNEELATRSAQPAYAWSPDGRWLVYLRLDETPVIIHWYGGPTLQLVSNRYGATSIFNHIERDVLYTQVGFIVWRLDSRGSFGRGHAFETPIYKEFGKAALDDQMAGVEYLRRLPYVDATRIGTDGKSFGGFLTLYALIHAPEVFKFGVDGSGPTDWASYDTIYTERYMQTPSENPDGYAAANLIAIANQLKAPPLIIHGLADTNVHLENSINFIQALEHYDKPYYFIPLPNENHHYQGDGLATALGASVDYFVRYMGSGQ